MPNERPRRDKRRSARWWLVMLLLFVTWLGMCWAIYTVIASSRL
jgi:hypothetical protein